MLSAEVQGALVLGQAYESRVLVGSSVRRKTGAHYTPFELAKRVASATLAAFVRDARTPEDIYGLSICDPAMGTGAFLIAAAESLAEGLADRFGIGRRASLPTIASKCLSGVDVDPGAVDVARRALRLLSGNDDAVGDRLVVGDALAAPLGVTRSAAMSKVRAFFEALEATAPKPVHWESAIGGVDVFVGNPPFVGGKRIATTHGAAYAAWLRRIHPDANGNVDLAAHFLRRAFDLLRPGGRMGFIVTNTIAQGDTRTGGLERILAQGGEIVEASTREPWPGDAAVVTSFVQVRKPKEGTPPGPAILDGTAVERITAFLRSGRDDSRPPRRAGAKAAFIGCFVRGAGFTFDDTSKRALPLEAMRAAVARNPKNRDVVHPYIGGEEVARHFEHAHHRYVIDLTGLSIEAARARHPELLALLEEKARPFRESLGGSAVDRAHKERWWRFANERPEMRRAVRGLERVIVIPRVAAHVLATFLPTSVIPSDQLVVVAKSDFGSLAVLQSRVHEAWARAYSSTLGDGLRYTPSACFETFPWPVDTSSLERLGEQMFVLRAAWLRRSRVGLTAFYNALNDVDDRSTGLGELRDVHIAIDRAVLRLYGFRGTLPERPGRWSDAERKRVLEFLRTLGSACVSARL